MVSQLINSELKTCYDNGIKLKKPPICQSHEASYNMFYETDNIYQNSLLYLLM